MDSSQAHMRSPSSSSSPPSPPSSLLSSPSSRCLPGSHRVGVKEDCLSPTALQVSWKLVFGEEETFGEVTFEEITFGDFQMPQRQRTERFFVSKFRISSIEHLKSNPSHTQTKAISHSPTLKSEKGSFTHCPILCTVRFQGSHLNVKLRKT